MLVLGSELCREIAGRLLQQKTFSIFGLRRGRHLGAKTLDRLQACPPVGLHLYLHGIGLGVLKHRGEPVREQTELAHEQRQVLGGDELEVADGRELRHARRALHGDAEVLVLVQAVGERRDGADRVRLDDDVHELELRRERVEAVGPARVVPDDAHKVVANVSLFIVEMRVVLVVRHQGGRVVQDLANVVPPRVCILAIFVGVEAPDVDVYLSAQSDEPTDPFEEACVRWRTVVVAKDVPFMRLARRNIHDSDFVRVDDGHPVQRTKKGRET